MIALAEGNTLSLKREGEMPSRGELLELWFSISFFGHNKEDTRMAMTRTTRISMTPITAITKNSINKDKDEDEEEGSGYYYGSGPGDKDGEDEDKDKHDYDYDLYL